MVFRLRLGNISGMLRVFLHSLKKVNKLVPAVVFVSLALWLLVLTPQGSKLLATPDYLPFKSKDKPIAEPHSDVVGFLKDKKNITEQYHVFKDDVDQTELLDFDRSHIKYIYPEVIDAIYNLTDKSAVDWSKYAYVLYATSSSHMCNAMMIFGELRKYNTRADLVLLVKKEFLSDSQEFERERNTLSKFATEYNVILKPTEVIQMGNTGSIWVSSFTKLMVFNETNYDRIIYMDSDAVLMKKNLDELFFLPPCKLAIPNAYWITKERFAKMSKSDIEKKYKPGIAGFIPMTTKKRLNKVMRLIKDSVWEFVDTTTSRLPITKPQNQETTQPDSEIKALVNKKNFYTNVYNNLPNYITFEEFHLTNIVMVIQPSKELFDKVTDAIKTRDEGEYDMDIVKNKLFEPFDIIKKQTAASFANNTDLPFDARFNETPELLIIPHQVYGTLSSQFNSDTDHRSFFADAHEQVFVNLERKTGSGKPAYYEINDVENVGDYMYQKYVNYFHFSDAPIPKPWYLQRPEKNYMKARTRCPEHADFNAPEGVVRPDYKTKDCSAAKIWEKAHAMFKKTRMEVCGLELIDTAAEDPYHNDIN